MRLLLKGIIFVLLFANSLTCFAQGKIPESKKELNTGSTESKVGKSTPTNTSSANDNCDNSFKNSITNLFFQIFLYITYYSVIGDYKKEDHLHNKVSKYPYYNTIVGNFADMDSTATIKKGFRFDVENQFLFSNKDLYGNHLKAKIYPFQYFNLQVDYTALMEHNKRTAKTDNLSLFNFNFGYDRLRFSRFNLGWTLGVSYIANNVQKAGFSYGLNTDIFIAKPISISSAIKWASINHKPVNQFEVKGNYHVKKYFISVGYERLKIATPTYHFLSFGGGIYL